MKRIILILLAVVLFTAPIGAYFYLEHSQVKQEETVVKEDLKKFSAPFPKAVEHNKANKTKKLEIQ